MIKLSNLFNFFVFKLFPIEFVKARVDINSVKAQPTKLAVTSTKFDIIVIACATVEAKHYVFLLFSNNKSMDSTHCSA